MKIKLNNVYKEYVLGKSKVLALNNISLIINRGEFICIAGPSGSGKTTLLNLLGCLDGPTKGELYFDELNINIVKERQKEKIRKDKIGFIFQSFNLIETLNVYENIEYPALSINNLNKGLSKKIEFLLNEVGIIDLKKRYPNELSGGQRQRVAIARAFINEPEIILADEPTANLDHKTGEIVIELMRKINKEKNTSLIFSTHDQEIIKKADRVIKIYDGTIQEN